MSRAPHHPADDPEFEASLERAWSPPGELAPGRPAPDAIRAAMGTFRRQRRNRLLGAGAACVVLLAVGWWAARPDAAPRPRMETADAVTYGMDLYARVFHDPADSTDNDGAYLKHDAAARAEYLAALDHPSSFVRRVAVDALGYSAVPIPPGTLARMLLERREDLESPLLVASVGDSGRVVAEALELRHLATVRTVLSTAFMLAATGQESLSASAVTPFLEHDDHAIRMGAAIALKDLEDYVPGDVAWRVMREDPDAQVRTTLVGTIHERLGAAGEAELLAYLASVDDPPVERMLLSVLRGADGIVAVARARFDAGVEDLETKVAYARLLARRGDAAPARALLPAAIRSGTGPGLQVACQLVSELDLTALRAAVLARQAGLDAESRRLLLWSVVGWDLRAGDRARATESLALYARHGSARDARRLARFEPHPDPQIQGLLKATRTALEARSE